MGQQHTPLEIAQRSLAGSLPSLPTVALDVLHLCQDPQSEIGELADKLSRDPILASKVLRMANSAFYNRGNEVTSLHRAAVMLGLRTLKVLALGFTLANELPQDGREAGFDLKRYWHRSLVNAVAARSIATELRARQREEAFVCGLLSQIGKLAIAQVVPQLYEPAVALGGGWPTEEIERETLGFGSSEVGEIILTHWGLPHSLVAAATYAERPEALPEDSEADTLELAAITALGVRAGSVLFDEHPAAGLRILNEEAERSYGWTPPTVDKVLESLHGGVVESAEAFAVELPSGRTYQEILDEARAQLVAVTLNTVMDLAQTTTALAEMTEENEVLQTRALTDPLTDLANRAALEDALNREVHQRVRGEHTETALGVLMIDIDWFKSLNDTYGHQNGDIVLRAVAQAMAAITRGSDLLTRYGGEEFCMVLPQTTHDGITSAAERVRDAVERTKVSLSSGETLYVSVSVGAAATDHVTDLEGGKQLIERADAALYRAKANGRNRIEVASEPLPASPVSA